MECETLPEGCIANILSRTTLVDACKLSLVSKTFYSAALSDVVWDHFLPSDFMSIISRSNSESSLLASSSKKSLYLALSQHPIIIDHATKSFQLDRKSGKKCYMLAARDLNFFWGDTIDYWTWKTLPESRFREVAELLDVCWLEIRGAINTKALSPNTQYAAYLVFKMMDAYGFHQHPVELSVDIFSGQSSTKNVCLDPNLEESELYYMMLEAMGYFPHSDLQDDEMQMSFVETHLQGFQHPNVRSDGWLEIEMGEFFNSGLEDNEVWLSVLETKGLKWKSGLFIEGI